MSQRSDLSIKSLVFDTLVKAAREGRRCPTNFEIAEAVTSLSGGRPRAASGMPAVIQQLVRDGYVTVRVYGANFREVLIHQGPEAGKSTLPPSHGKQPYRVIDKMERERRDKAPKWSHVRR
jgi:hypothetical protein